MIRLSVSILMLLFPALLHAACPPLSLLSRDLPDGKEGVRYEYRIVPVGGTSPVRLTIVEGLLPPGLSLSPEGVISGVPRGEGDYRVTVSAVDSCSPLPREVRQRYLIRIGDSPRDSDSDRRGKLRVEVKPLEGPLLLHPNETRLTLTHRLTATPPETAVMSSPGVSYLVDGSVVKSESLPLDLLLINGSGEVSEELQIPADVIQSARRGGGTIMINRPFVGRGTTAASVVTVTVEQVKTGNPAKGGRR